MWKKKSVSEIIVGLFQKFRLLLTRTKSMKQPLFKQDYIFSMIPLIGFWCEVSELCWHNSMSMLGPMLELKKIGK